MTRKSLKAGVKEGEELAQIAPNAVVKCPLTKDGLKAVKYLSGKGIRVNQTQCVSATQALLSGKAGTHVATMPFAVLEQLIEHALTDIGLKKFLDDWAKSGAKI